MPESTPNPAPRHAARAFFGSRRALLANPSAFYADVAWQHGGLARFRVFHRTFYAVAHPDLVHHILVARQEVYAKGPSYRNAAQVLGDGLITLEGEDWAADRAVIQPGLHKRAVAGIVPVINRACDEAFRAWDADPEGYHAVVPPVRMIGLRVIAETLLGTSLEAMQRAQMSERVMEATRLLTRKNWSPFPLSERWPTPLNRRLRRTRQYMLGVLEQQVTRRLAHGLGEHGDLLDLLLLSHRSGEGPRISRARVLSEMLTLLIAGYDTTSSSVAWAVYYLTQHPDLQAQLHAEADAVLGERAPTWEDLPRLAFTERVFNEALRLNPPVHTLSRTNTQPDTLGGAAVPAGAVLFVSLYGANRSPEHWEAPALFQPARFEPQRGRRYDPRAFVPFGAGPRRCLGALFATVEAKVILARIAQRYRFELQRGRQVRSAASSAQYPQDVVVRFSPRTTRALA